MTTMAIGSPQVRKPSVVAVSVSGCSPAPGVGVAVTVTVAVGDGVAPVSGGDSVGVGSAISMSAHHPPWTDVVRRTARTQADVLLLKVLVS
jgi:hypothetical protein